MTHLYSEEIGRKNNFDFLRFVLAVSVMFTHAFLIYQGKDFFEPLFWLTNKQLTLGTFAVNSFFIISGFLVLQSWYYSKGIFDFLKKRILRIYPGFIVVCLACAFVFGPLGNGNMQHPFGDYKAYISVVNFRYLFYTTSHLLPPFLPETFLSLPMPNDINVSLWTIWYEFVCYLGILCIGLLGLYKKKFILLSLFIVALILNLLHHNPYNTTPVDWKISFLSEDSIDRLYNMEHFAMMFLAGACFYYYRDYIPKTKWLVLLSIIVMLICFRWVRLFQMAQALFGSYLLFWVVFSKQLKLYNFAKYGDFSYGIYLYGWPVQQFVLLYFGNKLNIAGTFIVSLLIVFPLAMLSWHLVEKQFLKLKKLNISVNFFRPKSKDVTGL
ncbi:acyltransferase [soil metagenome]